MQYVDYGWGNYNGDVSRGQRNGRGVLTWNDGTTYTGEFMNDQKHGQGQLVWGQGADWHNNHYVGEFANDVRHGNGSWRFPDGRIYDGQWNGDNPVEGMAMDESGIVYHARYHGTNIMVGWGGQGGQNWAQADAFYTREFKARMVTHCFTKICVHSDSAACTTAFQVRIFGWENNPHIFPRLPQVCNSCAFARIAFCR
jgi:hypothetical protein